MQPLRDGNNNNAGSQPSQGTSSIPTEPQGRSVQPSGVPVGASSTPLRTRSALPYNTIGSVPLNGGSYSPYARPRQWDFGGAPVSIGGPRPYDYDGPRYGGRGYDPYGPDRFGPPGPRDPYHDPSPIRHHVQGLIDHILAGKAYEAFEKFYAENCVMSENGEDPRVGKSECRRYQQEFLGSIERWNDVRVGSVSVDGNKSAVEWTFDLSFYGGKRVVRRQVAIQTWAKGKIVEEVFYHA